ncbi:MAG: hypothetical protein LBT05_04880 [Planctomycetaceae bacterium]|jgi:hypothetical protein|nr:hypothetical protein [Planctomycetaceae bacterium]
MKNFIFLTLSFVLLAGCNNGKVQLGGKITFSDDGSPVPQGTIVFVQDAFQATGTIQADGSYVVGSLSEKDGLPPGNYAVWLYGVTEVLPGESERSLIDAKYESAETSGLTVQVDSSTKNYDLKLDRNPKKK